MPVAPRFAVCGKCCCVCKEPEALSSAVVGEIQGTQRSSHLLGLVCFLQVVLWLTQGEGALGLKEVKSCFWGGKVPSQFISHLVCFLSLAGPSPTAPYVVLDLEKGDGCEGDDCDPLMFVFPSPECTSCFPRQLGAPCGITARVAGSVYCRNRGAFPGPPDSFNLLLVLSGTLDFLAPVGDEAAG